MKSILKKSILLLMTMKYKKKHSLDFCIIIKKEPLRLAWLYPVLHGTIAKM